MKTIEIGSIISDDKQNYVISSLLGDGGFAVVYKALGDDGQNYAVKVMLNLTQQNLKSFYNEYNIATNIHSEHAIRYYYLNEYGINDYPCFIIMEYADGGSLTSMLKKRGGSLFSTDELKTIYLQLIDAMIDISSVAVHRDIKPDNILISCASGSLVFKISDYGIAKFEGEDTRTKTFKGIGSKLYYAPELWLNPSAHGLNDTPVDIYAMGIVFYQIANLQYPYDTSIDAKAMHLTSHWKPFNNQVDLVYKSMISKMMAKNRKSRYQNWGEIKDYLINSSVGQGLKRSRIAENIINNSLAQEESEKKKALENTKIREEKEQRFKMLVSQIESAIYYPLKKTVDEVRMDKRDAAILTDPNLSLEEETYAFEYLSHNNSRSISFKFETLYDEQPKQVVSFYTRIGERQLDRFEQEMLGGVQNKPFEYVWYQRKILLWGTITADCNAGINVAVFEDKDNPFGELVMFRYTPNYNNFSYSFPVSKKLLKKFISGYHDSNHTFEKIPFDIGRINELVVLNDICEMNSVNDPLNRGDWNFFM